MKSKYTLTKLVSGNKYVYIVTDTETGNEVSRRTSKRDYVACTANGEYYFGRIDLIGKGDHGKAIANAMEYLASPRNAYEKMIKNHIPSYREEDRKQWPFDKYEAQMTPYCKERLEEARKIAYLK